MSATVLVDVPLPPEGGGWNPPAASLIALAAAIVMVTSAVLLGMRCTGPKSQSFRE